MDYRKLFTSDTAPTSREKRIPSFDHWLEAKIAIERPRNQIKLKRFRIEPVPLPPAPPVPSSPPPLLAVADLETYISPLIRNGWTISGLRDREKTVSLTEFRCLSRTYRFTTYSAARHFLHGAVALMPPPIPGSLGGVHIELHSTGGIHEVLLFSISELAPDPPKKYGISIVDVRFAIGVETEFHKNWLGRADSTRTSGRLSVRRTLKELLNYKWKPARSKEIQFVNTP
ncbi:hypothetical protein DFH07DRAFT_394925 [Mycena maculata]|uniref:Uncharacterized protein n=1 Tax=Mycena maculata TaxID=230809 RepID=A0AAD7JEZ2_9AGAR|nr:hypothetical protein DFH07DRAFT_394925 [Mycena maculata]